MIYYGDMNNKDEKDEKAEKKTCKHFRYMIPNEDANELALSDKEHCEVCHNFIKRFIEYRFRYVQQEKLLC